MIDREDFDDVILKYQVQKIHLLGEEPSDEVLDDAAKLEKEIQTQAQLIADYVNLDYHKVLKMVRNVDSDFGLTSKLNSLIKEETKRQEEERKKKQEEEEENKRKQREGLFEDV